MKTTELAHRLKPYLSQLIDQKLKHGGGGATNTGGGGSGTAHDLDGPLHTGLLTWAKINKAGSSISDLANRSHALLSDLTTGDPHTQYVHMTTARIISARHAFNAGLDATTTANPGINIGDNNSGYLRIGSTGWYDDGTYFSPSGARTMNLQAVNVTSTDGDGAYVLGRTAIAGMSYADYAGFAHRDHATAASYALLHTSVADTILNAATGRQVYHRINNADTMMMNDARLMPAGSILKDLGDYNRKWRTLFAAELYVETLVAQYVMATIGGRVMVAPTTKLIADVSSGATSIDVEHNNIADNSYIFLQTAPAGIAQIEAMQVVSGPTPITGGYRHLVNRNLDGTGANAWVAGDAVVDLGAAVGKGYIDLTSTSTIHNHLGPTIAIYSRHSTATWNGVSPTVAFGNLRSFVDYSADAFGLAVGNDLTLTPSTGFKGFTGDRVNGLRMFNTAISLYDSATPTVLIQPYGDITAGSNINAIATRSLVHFGQAQTYNGESVDAGDMVFGNHAAGNMFWDRSAGQLKFRNGVTTKVYVSTAGAFVAGADDVMLDNGGLNLEQDTYSPVAARSVAWWSNVSTKSGNPRASVRGFTDTAVFNAETLELKARGSAAYTPGIVRMIAYNNAGTSIHRFDLFSDGYLVTTARLTMENTTDPTTPSGAGTLYVKSGSLYFRGSSGTITQVAVA